MHYIIRGIINSSARTKLIALLILIVYIAIGVWTWVFYRDWLLDLLKF